MNLKKIITKQIPKRILAAVTVISPTLSCYILYYSRMKTIPNLRNPKNFNEKMTVLKLRHYPNNKLVTLCSDKLGVRDYVKSKGYEYILNDLYGSYDNVDEISFDNLPQEFALKCTHGCAYNIICKDKNTLNVSDAKKQLGKWLNERYGYATQELHYTKIPPRIICEKYLCEDGKMPIDYKFFCFNGKVRSILVCSERETTLKFNWFNTKWEEQLFSKASYRSKEEIHPPKELDEMLKIAETLSKDFPFVRVDLYNPKGRIIFGELTFTPACCCAPYFSEEGLTRLGSYLALDKVATNMPHTRQKDDTRPQNPRRRG